MTSNRRGFVALALLPLTGARLAGAKAVEQDAFPVNGIAYRIRLTLAVWDFDGNPAPFALVNQTINVLRKRADMISPAGSRFAIDADRHIVVRLDGVTAVDFGVETLIARGLVEIIDPMGERLEVGSMVTTSFGGAPPLNAFGTPVAATPEPVFATIVTNDDFVDVFATTNSLGEFVVGFQLSPEGAEKLYAFTTKNLGEPMSIVFDNCVLSSPTINGVIYDQGIVEGMIDEEARALIVQLSSKSLPARLEIVSLEYR